ncbi:MAG: S9 family peptidase, partial [Acidimicrobiales bacterium]
MLAIGSPRPDERTQLIVIDLASGERRAVSPPDAWVLHWAWSPDGRRIIYAGDPRHSMQPDYYVADVATGESRQVTDDPGFVPSSSPAPPVWLDGDRVLLEVTSAADSELLVLETQSGVFEVIDRAEARQTSMSVDKSRRFVVQVESSPTSTGELSVYDREAGARTTITSYNRRLLTNRPPAQYERFEVMSDGGGIDAWLLKPPEFDPGKRYPVILDVHGGPASLYGSNFMALQQCLATDGFLVVYANPRGSSSYGRAFARANVRDWGGGDYRDLMAVVDAVLEREYADSDRTGIYGYSYGGY